MNVPGWINSSCELGFGDSSTFYISLYIYIYTHTRAHTHTHTHIHTILSSLRIVDFFFFFFLFVSLSARVSLFLRKAEISSIGRIHTRLQVYVLMARSRVNTSTICILIRNMSLDWTIFNCIGLASDETWIA